MTQGVPTPDEVEVEFRKHYLATGNIRASARQVKIAASTGQQLAERAQQDPAFVQARAAMYARALPDAERMLIGGIEIAHDRLEEGPEITGADLAASSAQKITIQDPGPQYLRSIAAAVDVIQKIRRFDAERNGDMPATGEVRIIVSPTPEAQAKIDATEPATDD